MQDAGDDVAVARGGDCPAEPDGVVDDEKRKDDREDEFCDSSLHRSRVSIVKAARDKSVPTLAQNSSSSSGSPSTVSSGSMMSNGSLTPSNSSGWSSFSFSFRLGLGLGQLGQLGWLLVGGISNAGSAHRHGG